MSAVYSKDPETGVYRAAVAPRARPIWILAIPCALSIFALAASVPRFPRRAATPVLSKSKVKPAFDPTKAPASLKGAMELYKTRGGRYILGRNDCSTFLLDYLVGHGIKASSRQTTATLIDPKVAEYMRLLPMDEMELSKPVDQSVVVIRYRGVKNDVVGHCAVRLFQEGKPYFVHNCESEGLVYDDQTAFYGRFDRSKVKDVRYYRFEGG